MNPNDFNHLCNFLQRNQFKVVIVEGPRGIGKTTFVENLLKQTNMIHYKTWGGDQKWIRHDMQNQGLTLPQGTYFVLDFIRQVEITRPVLADRGNLSGVVYQHDQPYSTNQKLLEYYVSLMDECSTVMLYLTGPVDVLLKRRTRRTSQDEQGLDKVDPQKAREIVEKDVGDYEVGLNKMILAGLTSIGTYNLDEGCTCSCFVPRQSVERIVL